MSGNSRRHLCTQRNIRFSVLMMAILAPWRRASLTAAAESDPELALQLGLHFVNRSRASRDPVGAMRLFRIAAKAGKAAAVLEMGILYGEGDGVERNDAEALRLLRMAPNLRTSGAFRRVTRLVDAPAR